MVAVSNGRDKCLQLLLDKGADVNQKNEVSSFHHVVVTELCMFLKTQATSVLGSEEGGDGLCVVYKCFVR